MCGGMLGCHNRGDATGVWWVEANNAAKHPTVQESPHDKELSHPNVNSAEAEKPN